MTRRLVLALALMAACATPAPRRPAPPAAPELTLHLTPAVALAGASVWVRCYVPAALGPGRLRFGIDGVRASELPSPPAYNELLIERLPCLGGPLTAFCLYATLTRLYQRVQALDVLGCSGGP